MELKAEFAGKGGNGTMQFPGGGENGRKKTTKEERDPIIC